MSIGLLCGSTGFCGNGATWGGVTAGPTHKGLCVSPAWANRILIFFASYFSVKTYISMCEWMIVLLLKKMWHYYVLSSDTCFFSPQYYAKYKPCCWMWLLFIHSQSSTIVHYVSIPQFVCLFWSLGIWTISRIFVILMSAWGIFWHKSPGTQVLEVSLAHICEAELLSHGI